MSSRAIPRLSKNIYRSGRIFSESFLKPQKQQATINHIRNMQFRTVGDFAEMPAFKAMTKVNRFNRLSRVEMNRIQVILATSLVSNTVSIVQMLEDLLKASSSSEEDEEGSGSRVYSLDGV